MDKRTPRRKVINKPSIAVEGPQLPQVPPSLGFSQLGSGLLPCATQRGPGNLQPVSRDHLTLPACGWKALPSHVPNFASQLQGWWPSIFKSLVWKPHCPPRDAPGSNDRTPSPLSSLRQLLHFKIMLHIWGSKQYLSATSEIGFPTPRRNF